MLSIDSVEVKTDPRTFTPHMHVSFVLNMEAVRGRLDRPEDDLALIIGQEVLNQTKLWHALRNSNEVSYEMA